MDEYTNRLEEARTTKQPLLLSAPDAAHLLGIGLTFTWQLVHSGQLPSMRLGKQVLISRHTLEQFATGSWRDQSSA